MREALRVINTDTLESFISLDRGGIVDACHPSRESLTTSVVISCGGLTDSLNTREVRCLKLLTLSRSAGADFTSPGREGRESLLVVDTDGAMGS